jgi:oxygen-independent coproporphyrinogen-3 oxidase
MNISLDLLKKYNVPGPRYTSYPPAPSWSADIGPAAYEAALKQSNAGPSPRALSLYFHLPFCEQLCLFCGCTTVITGRDRRKEDPYMACLQAEINWVAERVEPRRRVVQLHLGGGTPTYYTPEKLEMLMTFIKSKFTFDDEAELGIEVDPRVTSTEHLRALQKHGFNRLSMGVQDFDPTVQKAINRHQFFDSTKGLVDQARSLGFQSINMDLIYGLPYQTEESFASTIDKILSLSPDRLAVYSYAHVPWMKKHQDTLAPFLPTEQQKFNIFLLALKRFTESGFVYIGMDHFAKPTDELSIARENGTLWRNFMGYTTKAGTDLIGFGMSAIGRVGDTFIQNQRELVAYQENALSGGAATVRGFNLSQDDLIRSHVIQTLLCHALVVKADVERRFTIVFDDYFVSALQALKPLVEDGLVELSRESIRPTEIGRIFLRNIAMPFDAYLPKDGEKRMFSKTV